MHCLTDPLQWIGGSARQTGKFEAKTRQDKALPQLKIEIFAKQKYFCNFSFKSLIGRFVIT